MQVRFSGIADARWMPARHVRLSCCMMVGNEAEFIGGAIENALGWADEVTVLDTGSTDGTATIAEALGARVTRVDLMRDLGDGLRSIDDFGAARTRALGLGTGDWLVLLDADDRLHIPQLRRVLERIDERVDLVTAYVGHSERNEAEPLPRAFRRTSAPRYEHRVHETLDAWLESSARATAHLPLSAGYVEHLGAIADVRQRARRDERNEKLLALMLAGNPNDVHALGYVAQRITQQMNAQ